MGGFARVLCHPHLTTLNCKQGKPKDPSSLAGDSNASLVVIQKDFEVYFW